MAFYLKANLALTIIALGAYPILSRIPLAKVNYPLPLSCCFFFAAGLILSFFAAHTPVGGIATTLGDLYVGGVKHTSSLVTAVIVLNFFFAVAVGLCLQSGANITTTLTVWMSMMLLAGMSYDMLTGNSVSFNKAAVMLVGVTILLYGFSMTDKKTVNKASTTQIQEG